MTHKPGYRYALTTFDNPFDPFTDFTHWYLYDVEKGYNTSSLIGRIAMTSDQLSEDENNIEIARAIDEILKYDFLNQYKKLADTSQVPA